MALSFSEPERPAVTCTVGRWLVKLDAKDRAAFDDAVGKILDQRARLGERCPTGYTVAWLRAELTKAGVVLDTTALQRHIRRACRCQQ